MSKDNKANEPVNASELLRTLVVVGSTYTNVRHAVIAHMLLHGVKSTLIANEGKVEPSEVSRIAKLVKDMSPKSALYRQVRDLDLRTVRDAMSDPLSTVLADIGKIGANFKRTTNNNKKRNNTGAPKLPAPESGTVRVAGDDGRSSDRDIMEVVFEWLVADYATRLPLVNAMIANADSYVAEKAAEEDSEELAA